MIRYTPSPSVTALLAFSINAGLAASTVTPGSTPPLVSRTMPVMLLWACAAVDRAKRATESAKPRIRNLHVIPTPPLL
jgi:hypothetical protein